MSASLKKGIQSETFIWELFEVYQNVAAQLSPFTRCFYEKLLNKKASFKTVA